MADQNLPVSDEIATLVGHFLRPIFCCNIWLYQLQIKFYFLICYSFECTFLFMSNQIFLLSDQNGALVGHMSFQGKKNYLQPCAFSVTCIADIFCHPSFDGMQETFWTCGLFYEEEAWSKHRYVLVVIGKQQVERQCQNMNVNTESSNVTGN